MRKTLLATSALVAALAFAGAASAQNVAINPSQTNNARVGSTLNLGPVAVGARLDGSATSIGNLIQADGGFGQFGIVTGQQVNNGAVDSVINVSATTAAATDLSAVSAANVINVTGGHNQTTGNQSISQINYSPVSSTLSITGNPAGSLGNATTVSAAQGNSYSATAGVVLALDGVFTQTNNGSQTAVTQHNFNVNAGSLDSTTLALGNSISVTAPAVSVEATQTNNAGQSATLNLAGGFQSVNASASSLGNVFSTASPLTYAPGSTGMTQVNNAAQQSTANIGGGGVGVFNGGALTVSASAIGNVVSVSGGQTLVVGSQLNNANQSSVLNANGPINVLQANSVSSFSSQSIGNLVSADVTARFDSTMPQTNFGMVSSTTNVFGGSYAGTVNASSLSAGNILQVDALGSVDAGALTSAMQVNSGPISSLTNIAGGSFAGALTASATSIGNLTSVGIR